MILLLLVSVYHQAAFYHPNVELRTYIKWYATSAERI